MPILDVDKARQVFVIKRGRGTGFAGIENALFYADNTRMVYGDAQDVAESPHRRGQEGLRRRREIGGRVTRFPS